MTERDLLEIFDDDRDGGIAIEPAASWARRASALVASIIDDEQRVSLRFQFEERIAVCMVDGGLGFDDAERVAYLDIAGMAKRGQL